MLMDLKAGDKPTLLVFNKIDAYRHILKEEDDLTPSTRENLTLKDIENSWIRKANTSCIFISATSKLNIEQLRQQLISMVKKLHFVRYPNYLG
jgi:GTP-binding protein HflX